MAKNEQLDKDKVKAAVKRLKKETYTPVQPEMQLGFVHNNVECIGCRACEIACKDKNGLEAGPRFRRVSYVEGGTYPEVYAYKVNMSCNHCAQPACLPTCPTGAIYKRKKDGIVEVYYADGKVLAQIAYVDNKRHGRASKYNHDGTTNEEVHYTHGKVQTQESDIEIPIID